MNADDVQSPHILDKQQLDQQPSFIWPEARWHAGLADYSPKPPFATVLQKADLIAGVLVDSADKTIHWLQELLGRPGTVRLRLVLITYPACPTREEHLLALKLLQGQESSEEKDVQIRVLPLESIFGPDSRKATLPPTMLLSHQFTINESWLCLGSVSDSGHDDIHVSSFNVVFKPDDGLRDAWRRWFQYLFEKAVPLTTETVRIPHLVPPPGDPEAAELWAQFEKACASQQANAAIQPKVDARTGEVEPQKNKDGTPSEPWDQKATKLDLSAKYLQQVYATGWLATVDETTRVKPLAIPVSARLLDQESERAIGALTQRQSFSLTVFDAEVDKDIEKCRKITDIMNLLSYSLSHGNRWMPEAAKALLEKELAARNTRGREILKKSLGKSVEDYVASRKDKFRADLNRMYRELGRGNSLPETKLSDVLNHVETRLKAALQSNLAPKVVFNRIAPPDLTEHAPLDNWSQPYALLSGAAELLRTSITDDYFRRNFAKRAFSQEEFEQAMDVFGDIILQSRDRNRAMKELQALTKVDTDDMPLKQRAEAVLAIIGKTITP